MKPGILGLGRIGKVLAMNPSAEGLSFPQRYGIPLLTDNQWKRYKISTLTAPTNSPTMNSEYVIE